MPRKPATTTAKTRPVSVRLSSDDLVWLKEISSSTSLSAVICEAVALLRNKDNELYEPDPEAGFVPDERPVTTADFAALATEVGEMAAAMSMMTKQLADATGAMRCIVRLLDPDTNYPATSDAVARWEQRRTLEART